MTTALSSRSLLRALVALLLTLGLATGLLAGSLTPAAAADQPLSFTSVADTYVDSNRPSSLRGTATKMDADASPVQQALVRFDLASLQGREVTGVRLRLHQVDASRTGGRVRGVLGAWSESTTWSTRPALDGNVLATFGAVTAGSWYELELPVSSISAGQISFGIDSASSDGAAWATRESATPPTLLVTTTPIPAAEVDGLSQIADASVGSSDPTYYAGNRRTALTSGGRQLVLHGLHASGLQLAWRDPGGSWSTRSTGASSTGGLLTGTGTGDWPASIAVATDARGVQTAWVVWSGQNSSSLKPVQLRRITELDAATGPRLGPVVTVDAAPRGAYRADIAFERAPDGSVRGCILYSRRVADTAYELATVWFSELGTDVPSFHSGAVLETSSSSSHYGSLVTTGAGLRAVTRAGSGGGSLLLYGHDAAAPLTSWWTGAKGPAIPGGSSPTGVGLASGEVIAAVEDDLTQRISTVFRFSAAGTTGTTLLRSAGLAQPTVATDGVRVWLVAVRAADGAVVTRMWSSATGWDSSERVEVPGGAAGPMEWPNVLREAGGRLRFVMGGPGTTSNRSSVLAFQRVT